MFKHLRHILIFIRCFFKGHSFMIRRKIDVPNGRATIYERSSCHQVMGIEK